AVLEVDRPGVVPHLGGDAQHAGLPAQVEQLEDVMDPELAQLAFDRHGYAASEAKMCCRSSAVRACMRARCANGPLGSRRVPLPRAPQRVRRGWVRGAEGGRHLARPLVRPLRPPPLLALLVQAAEVDPHLHVARVELEGAAVGREGAALVAYLEGDVALELVE